ncbi:MAG: terminase gpA endonuclease subunit [Vicingaceae bacterium]
MEAIYSKIEDLLLNANYKISNLKPSEWAEKKRVMTTDVSPRPGKFSFKYTPYLKEVLDTLSSDHPAHTIAVMKGAQIGFALDIETLIPTPNGMVKMGDLKLGDYVYDETGNEVKIIKVSDVMYNHKCYDVTFTDGSIIKADAEHLWTVYDLKNVKRTLNTEYISKRVKQVRKSGESRNRYYVYNTKPIICEEKELKINPYLLGLWLGDGNTNGNRLTCEKKDLKEYINELEKEGIKTTYKPYKNYDNCYYIHLKDVFNTWKGGYNIYGNKHIPEEYFTSSIEQRLSLLQGLIDTDGHVKKNGGVEFYNTNKKLILQVKRLISSLGFKVTIRKRDNSGKLTNIVEDKRYKMKDIYILNFTAYKELPVARLKRKRNRLKSIDNIRGEISKKWICDIKEVDSVPVKCITVDNESHLYLAGEGYIPTHNSTGVIENGVGFIIDQQPGNILFLTGHADLAEEAMSGKIDNMIDQCGLRDMIRPNVLRKKNQRTGDTNKSKEFPGGSLTAGAAGNHKLLRQRSVRYGFIDDYDAAKHSTKESGSTQEMIEQRFAAYASKKKLYFISTPELKQTSNIEPVYELGDQRRYHVPCPCCGDYIILEWTIQVDGKTYGITYDIDDEGNLIEGSVGYKCQSCGGFFSDKNKDEMLKHGFWKPTAKPSEEGYYSYHISALYSPSGMDDWEKYVRQYLKANPVDGEVDEGKMQTFVNLCLGLTYEEKGKSPKSNKLQKNIRDYNIGILPEKISDNDGNGKIMLLTCACDLNGKIDDARLDYEIVAWTETGSSYSIKHGSIGTFIPRENQIKNKVDREHWTYKIGEPNNVWEPFLDIIDTIYETDTGRRMKISITGVDTGNTYEGNAYAFVESQRGTDRVVYGLKGKDKDRSRRIEADTPSFKRSRERDDLYLVEGNMIKDKLSDTMEMNWNKNYDQPPGFMNFPLPSERLYSYKYYFSHFESEHRIVEKNRNGAGVSMRWVKKNSAVQNHLWDCRIYNIALKDIFTFLFCKDIGLKTGSWKDVVDVFLGNT